jgi:thiamine-monophosphate kinase
LNEFDIIRSYFAQQQLTRNEVVLGIGDDAAITKVAAGMEQVITTDTLVSGTHFPTDTLPADIGHKALAVSLSDLASMGAEPVWFTLNLCLPEFNHDWLSQFTAGLFSVAAKHNVCLVGGDTVKGQLSISIQAAGQLPAGSAMLRSGAKVADKIFVSGFIGDAALAFACREGGLDITGQDLIYINDALNKPVPRVELGQKLRAVAHCAIDISDGLVADLGHILTASQCGATIDVDKLPQSRVFKKYADQVEARELALAFGDDYELCFTAPEKFSNKIMKLGQQLDCPITVVGEIENTLGLRFKDASGSSVAIAEKGYDHFSEV